jgi:hypothetical protein
VGDVDPLYEVQLRRVELVPQQKETVAASPLSLTRPFIVAPDVEKLVAASVVTLGTFALVKLRVAPYVVPAELVPAIS